MSESAVTPSFKLTAATLKSALRSDVLFAGAIMSILALLVLPTPRWLLDILLACSVTFAVMVL
ncbi:MAG: hypothetical protein AAGJ87_07155, partial [Pseudomonadota bacterium]